MTYQIHFIKSGRKGMGQYKYQILKDRIPIATYAYDMRDNQQWVTMEDSATETWSLSVNQFLQGGGKDPLELTDFATDYLNDKLSGPPDQANVD